MSSCVGAASGGSVTQLMALGALDTFLSANPSITFFRFRYNKHTNFSMESIEQPFNSNVQFGASVQCTLNRTGDLIYYQYAIIDLPGIKACPATAGTCGAGSQQFPCCDPCDPAGDGAAPGCDCGGVPAGDPINDDTICTGLDGPWAHWVNAIGQFLIKKACLIIGGQVVDTLYNDYLFMWEELAGKPGKRLQEMIGKRYTVAGLVSDSQQKRRLYVPLPFWYTQSSGNALALISLQFHNVQITIEFEELARCIQRSSCEVAVVKCSDCQPVTNADLDARLETTYVFLDIVERDKFATGSFEQLITQVQTMQVSQKACQVRLNLNFNHAMIELLWAVRRRTNEACNNHFNYSGKYSLDPVKYVDLHLNNLPRFTGKEGRYFRLVQPFQHHSLIPEHFVYCYSFAINPEEPQPSGSANFSRIDNVTLVLTLQDQLVDEEVKIIVFGRSWNVFRYRQGLGGTAFSS